MGQNLNIALVAQSNGGTPGLLETDSATALSTGFGLPIAGLTASSSALNQSAAAVIKATPGRLIGVNVTANSGTIATALYDQSTSGTAVAGNLIMTIPGTVAAGTTYTPHWPCLNGIALIPTASSGITLSLAYS